MFVNTVNFYTFSNFGKSKMPKKKNCPTFEQKEISNLYYFPVSFGRELSAKDFIKKIGEENFPSDEILREYKAKGENGADLLSIHQNYYRELSGCKTLSEAKELYPEFKNVIDAKDLTQSDTAKSKALQEILSGKNQQITPENLSLEILKRYYLEIMTPNRNKDCYFGYTGPTVINIMKILNIPLMNNSYFFAISHNKEEIREKISSSINTPEVKSKISQAQKESWTQERRDKQREWMYEKVLTPEAKEKQAETKKSQEFKDKMSQIQKSIWAKDDGSRAERQRQWAVDVLQSKEVTDKRNQAQATQESKDKKSKSIRTFFKNNPKYGEAEKLAYARHPEYSEARKRIALQYPGLTNILRKKEQNIELTETETTILNKYYRQCHDEYPEMSKVIMGEYHNILVEWGIKEE